MSAQMNVDIVFNLKEKGENLSNSFKEIVEQANNVNEKLREKFNEPINIKCSLDLNSLNLENFFKRVETFFNNFLTDISSNINTTVTNITSFIEKEVSYLQSGLTNIENIITDFFIKCNSKSQI